MEREVAEIQHHHLRRRRLLRLRLKTTRQESAQPVPERRGLRLRHRHSVSRRASVRMYLRNLYGKTQCVFVVPDAPLPKDLARNTDMFHPRPP